MAGVAAEAPRADETPAIFLRGVNKWFGEFHVLRDIDLTVSPGERIVICGPSGSRALRTTLCSSDGRTDLPQ